MVEHVSLRWSKDTLLKWSDFKAESNPTVYEDSHSVIKFQYTWIVNSERINDEILFFIEDVRLFVEFNPLLSWVRKSNADDLLLKHEQGHFDLAELIKQENLSKLQDIFYGKKFPTRGSNEEQRKQFAKEDSGKLIGIEVKKLELELIKRSEEYDEQTNYGKNQEKQKEYNFIFDKLRT
ncbi:MAG: hypothetical protein HKM23_04895 [Nitrosopumilus sp.]|nr:hypothetical protein [Nitrosopumilus sp.]NNL59526.1 hypothetical protein [Nitrosopumilus sp.]